jgi:hypothetical protein
MLENAPGGSTGWLATERRDARRKLGFLGVCAVGMAALLYVSPPAAIAFPLILLCLWTIDYYCFGWMDFARADETYAFRGVEGEERVKVLLEHLPDCVVLHDVAADYGTIDYVVIRKDGAIFLIETKPRRGTVTDAVAAEYLKQTHWNVYWLRAFLISRLNIKPWIHAAIVFPDATVKVRHPIRGVDIIGGSYLDRWIFKARGNYDISQKLWAEVPRLKSELRCDRQG